MNIAIIKPGFSDTSIEELLAKREELLAKLNAPRSTTSPASSGAAP